MLDLRDLIIERIEEANNLAQNSRAVSSSSTNNLESECQANRIVLKQFSLIRKREKERMIRQKQLLESIKTLRFWHPKVMENLYTTSLSIFTKHSFWMLSSIENGQTIVEKLALLYRSFFQKQHGKVSSPELLMVIYGHIQNSNPFTLLSWVSQWSRSQLSDKIQEAMSGQFYRHQQEMKRISVNKSNINHHHKEKINPLSLSSQIQKNSEIGPPKINFTNKESVFGLFLDQLLACYRSFPLDLDTGFLKSIRKLHSKGSQFQRQDNLQKAVEVLIESKNKHTKQQIQQYKDAYYNKYPKRRPKSELEKRMISPSKGEKKLKKCHLANESCFERIKSQSKDEDSNQKKNNYQNRNSLLLCPKTNQISFENSQDIIRKLKRQKNRKELELPEIWPHKLGPYHSKSTANRSKPTCSLFTPSCGSVVNIEDPSVGQTTFKCYQFKPKSFERILKKHNLSSTKDSKADYSENPEREAKKCEGDELKKNRKLMLQLLREKNRYAFLQK